MVGFMVDMFVKLVNGGINQLSNKGTNPCIILAMHYVSMAQLYNQWLNPIELLTMAHTIYRNPENIHIYIYIWRFPTKRGYPQIIRYNTIFHFTYTNHPFLRVPPFLENPQGCVNSAFPLSRSPTWIWEKGCRQTAPLGSGSSWRREFVDHVFGKPMGFPQVHHR